MTVRPYRSTDEAACLEVFHSNSDKFFAIQEESLFRRFLLRVLDLDNSQYFVLEEEGEIRGCGGFVISEEKNRAILAWGMIHREYQQRGYGQRLLRYRIDKIRELLPEGKIVALDTSQHTYEFFEKMGFELISIKKNYYGEGLDRYDMEMKLGQMV